MVVVLIFVLGLAVGLQYNRRPTTSLTSPNTVILPIDPKSSGVRTAGLVYLLNGVVGDISFTSKDNKDGYEIKLLRSNGLETPMKFFARDDSATIVQLDKDGKESKYSLSGIKKGDSIFLNYYIDLRKDPQEPQVTKVAVSK